MLSCLSLLSSKIVRRKVRNIHLYAVSGLENLLDPSFNCYSVERKLIHDGDDDDDVYDDDDDDEDDDDEDVDDDLLSTGLLDIQRMPWRCPLGKLYELPDRHRDEGEQIIEET